MSKITEESDNTDKQQDEMNEYKLININIDIEGQFEEEGENQNDQQRNLKIDQFNLISKMSGHGRQNSRCSRYSKLSQGQADSALKGNNYDLNKEWLSTQNMNMEQTGKVQSLKDLKQKKRESPIKVKLVGKQKTQLALTQGSTHSSQKFISQNQAKYAHLVEQHSLPKNKHVFQVNMSDKEYSTSIPVNRSLAISSLRESRNHPMLVADSTQAEHTVNLNISRTASTGNSPVGWSHNQKDSKMLSEQFELQSPNSTITPLGSQMELQHQVIKLQPVRPCRKESKKSVDKTLRSPNRERGRNEFKFNFKAQGCVFKQSNKPGFEWKFQPKISPKKNQTKLYKNEKKKNEILKKSNPDKGIGSQQSVALKYYYNNYANNRTKIKSLELESQNQNWSRNPSVNTKLIQNITNKNSSRNSAEIHSKERKEEAENHDFQKYVSVQMKENIQTKVPKLNFGTVNKGIRTGDASPKNKKFMNILESYSQTDKTESNQSASPKNIKLNTKRDQVDRIFQQIQNKDSYKFIARSTPITPARGESPTRNMQKMITTTKTLTFNEIIQEPKHQYEVKKTFNRKRKTFKSVKGSIKTDRESIEASSTRRQKQSKLLSSDHLVRPTVSQNTERQWSNFPITPPLEMMNLKQMECTSPMMKIHREFQSLNTERIDLSKPSDMNTFQRHGLFTPRTGQVRRKIYPKKETLKVFKQKNSYLSHDYIQQHVTANIKSAFSPPQDQYRDSTKNDQSDDSQSYLTSDNISSIKLKSPQTLRNQCFLVLSRNRFLRTQHFLQEIEKKRTKRQSIVRNHQLTLPIPRHFATKNQGSSITNQTPSSTPQGTPINPMRNTHESSRLLFSEYHGTPPRLKDCHKPNTLMLPQNSPKQDGTNVDHTPFFQEYTAVTITRDPSYHLQKIAEPSEKTCAEKDPTLITSQSTRFDALTPLSNIYQDPITKIEAPQISKIVNVKKSDYYPIIERILTPRRFSNQVIQNDILQLSASNKLKIICESKPPLNQIIQNSKQPEDKYKLEKKVRFFQDVYCESTGKPKNIFQRSQRNYMEGQDHRVFGKTLNPLPHQYGNRL